MTAKCPLMGECVEHGCRWYTHVLGQNPQTGETLDRWACAVELLPMLLVENTKHAREAVAQASASTELHKQALRSAALQAPTDELLRLVGVSRA